GLKAFCRRDKSPEPGASAERLRRQRRHPMAEADPKNLSDAHTEMPSLEGRKAIITGGTTGIGRAIGVLLASEGVEIFTCGRDERHLADGLERINEVGKGDGISVDLAERDGLEKFFDTAGKRLGSYDIAVINAAVPVE